MLSLYTTEKELPKHRVWVLYSSASSACIQDAMVDRLKYDAVLVQLATTRRLLQVGSGCTAGLG